MIVRWLGGKVNAVKRWDICSTPWWRCARPSPKMRGAAMRTAQLFFLTRKSGDAANVAKNISTSRRLSLERNGVFCHYCGDRKFQTFDHVIPRSKGGSHESKNLVPCCRSCNSSKGTKSYDDFLFYIRAEKIAYEMYLECGGADAQL